MTRQMEEFELTGTRLDCHFIIKAQVCGDIARVLSLAVDRQKLCIRAFVTQVRQPIYAQSVQRWRHYEDMLVPLLLGL